MPRIVPPDTARVTVVIEGTFNGSDHIHRVLTECAVERRMLLTNCEDFAGVGRLEFGFVAPCDAFVPVAVTLGVVEENDIFLDQSLGNRLVLGTDFTLADVVVRWSVWTREIDGFLPFAILLDADAAEDVDACTDFRRLFSEFFDAGIGERDVFRRFVRLELVKEFSKQSRIVECLLEQDATDTFFICHFDKAIALSVRYRLLGGAHSVCVYSAHQKHRHTSIPMADQFVCLVFVLYVGTFVRHSVESLLVKALYAVATLNFVSRYYDIYYIIYEYKKQVKNYPSLGSFLSPRTPTTLDTCPNHSGAGGGEIFQSCVCMYYTVHVQILQTYPSCTTPSTIMITLSATFAYSAS